MIESREKMIMQNNENSQQFENWEKYMKATLRKFQIRNGSVVCDE